MDARNNENLKDYEKVPCIHCDRYKTYEGHDGCLKELPFLMNACCGHHGHGEGRYIQFKNGWCIRGWRATIMIAILKLIRYAKEKTCNKK